MSHLIISSGTIADQANEAVVKCISTGQLTVTLLKLKVTSNKNF